MSDHCPGDALTTSDGLSLENTFTADAEHAGQILRKPATASGRPASLVVFSDDWGRHPSSCQHLIRRLLP